MTAADGVTKMALVNDGSVRRFTEIAEAVLQQPASATRLVAIDGPSGSGKSTFAARLAHALAGAPIVAIDDFLSWTDLEGWWPRFEAEVVTPLLDGRVARYQVRDWIADPFGDAVHEWRETMPADVVIIEGNTSSRRAVARRLGLAVWVEAQPALRLERGVARDGEPMRGRWLDWMTMESAFFALDATKQRAAIRVDGAPSIPHDSEREFVLLRDP
jgi:hypothetical protein